MKIKFFSDYDCSEELLKRFRANYDVFDDSLSFVTDEDYDFAVVFNRSREPVKFGAKIITVIQEPSWNEVHEVMDFLLGSDYLIIHDPELFEQRLSIKLGGKVIKSPSFMFYHDHLERRFFECADKIVKKKKLSIIISSLYRRRGNYRKRIEILMKILDSNLDIDIYGKGLNLEDSRYKGELKYKADGLLPYEYSIAIENANEENYITEKFVDCILCNTIPIYNGAPNIADVYDKRYFNTIDIESPTIVDDIKHIIKQTAPVSNMNRKIYFEKYNLYAKLKEIILG